MSACINMNECVHTEKQLCVKEKSLRGWGLLFQDNEIGSRKASLSNKFMSLKAYQTTEHCAVVYYINKKDCYNYRRLSQRQFILDCNHSEVNSKNTPLFAEEILHSTICLNMA